MKRGGKKLSVECLYRERETVCTHHQINQLLRKKHRLSHSFSPCMHYKDIIMALKSTFIVAVKLNYELYYLTKDRKKYFNINACIAQTQQFSSGIYSKKAEECALTIEKQRNVMHQLVGEEKEKGQRTSLNIMRMELVKCAASIHHFFLS